jgi:putative ABC transport system substrate-binding protein
MRLSHRLIEFGLAALLVCSIPAQAQQPKKTSRIGYLSAYESTTESTRTETLRRALRELGYIEGQNILIEYRYAEGKRDKYPNLAAEMVRLKVDVIVVSGGLLPIQATRNATKTIPIVMTGVGADPVKTGLVESLAHPGGNVTGITNVETLGGKRLELLKESVPKLARLAVLYDPAVPAGRQERDDLLIVARALEMTIQPWEIRAAADLEKVFAAFNEERSDGLYASESLVITANAKRIADFAAKNRLPSMYSSREAVYAGGLMYYGSDLEENYRRVATYVDRILKGAKPGDLPVEQPTKFELFINLKTAKQIGLTIPSSVLAKTDRAIK